MSIRLKVGITLVAMFLAGYAAAQEPTAKP